MLRTWRGPLLGMALALLVAGCATSTHPVPHSTTTKRGSTLTNITTAISKWQVVLKNDQVVYTSLTCPTTERCIAGGFGPIIDLSYPPGDPIPMPTPEFGVISNTQDGGKHWTTIRMARPVAAVACMSKVRCIAVEREIYTTQIQGGPLG